MGERVLELSRREQIVNGLVSSYGTSRESAERAADRIIARENGDNAPREALGRMIDRAEAQVAIAEDGSALTALMRGATITSVSIEHPFRLKRDQMSDDEIGKLEDEIQQAGYKLLRALGFEVVHLSQKRASKQTPGVADSKFYHRVRRLSFWWEAKMERGVQSPAQREFQTMAEACGEHYVVGGLGILRTWLAGRRVCVFGADNTPIPLPIKEQA